jgi:4-cresol dehydrogenase (hydroxylating) flavoprotein subunit
MLEVLMDSRALVDAIGEWTRLLGPTSVVHDTRTLDSASTATFSTTARALAILHPGNREEVQDCLRVANRHGIAVYPISSGKNWGYGSRVPIQDAVLLDLARLDRIVDFDEDLAYVTIEPGVTQRQLHAFLRDRKSRLWMDATGASPDCSIIGNTMERGFGHTPMGDHCGSACGLEVVLPDGEVLETGFARFEGATTSPLSRWGVGPSLDGLFSQSNMGIVTRMSVWLMPAPERFEAFFFLSHDRNALGPIIDALRPLRLNGTLRSVMHIGNDYKVLTATSRYPWDERPDGSVLDEVAMAAIRKAASIGCWNGSGGLYGTRAQVREAKRLLRKALAGKVDRLQFVDDRLIGLMSRFATPFRAVTGWDVRRTLKVLVPVYDLLKGVPTDATMASSYWRKKGEPPARMDPDADGCGLLWYSPVVPNTGRHAAEVAELTRRLLVGHGFEPQMSISLATERTLICVITISYDRHVPGEDARALRCYRELGAQLLERGYPPYRLGLRAMDYVQGQDGYTAAVTRIKQALDPNGILAPGRYEPSAAVKPASGQPAHAAVPAK